ncbi:MAG: hypothetical protein DRP82_05575 [Planctomycetota bacterium]|nr:MAG: hypothetical protein DRP82_05575 [Planctomycetota bacterium]
MRVAVVGPGAVGRLFAAFLSEAADVVLVDYKKERAKALSQNGYRLTGLASRHVKIPVVVEPEGAFDAVVVCVKAYSTAAVAQKLKQWSGSAAVLTFQNGMGNAETLQKAVGAERLVVGTNSYGANIAQDDPYLVHYAGRGEVVLGILDEAAEDALTLFLRLFEQAGICVRKTGDINAVLWEKLLVNAAINPLCALLGIRNGQLPRLPSLWRIATGIVREGEAVAAAAGVAIAQDMIERVRKVCEKTANNRCSTLQDISAKRLTEIPYINGYIAKKARELGVPAPLNGAIAAIFDAYNSLHSPGGTHTDGNS